MQEFNLSRLLHQILKHDTGTISAFRSQYTHKENLKRNKQLLAKVFCLGYDVTSVDGVYVENYGTDSAVEVAKDTFFVVDTKNKGTLEQDLRKLGEEYNQDFILFIPRPGDEFYLWGTNLTGYPGYGNCIKYSHSGREKIGEFMTKSKDRPFNFESINKELVKPDGLGWMAAVSISKMDWREIPL